MRIVGGDENTDGKRTKNIEEQDTPEHSANCLWNILARILSLTSGDCNKFNSTI